MKTKEKKERPTEIFISRPRAILKIFLSFPYSKKGPKRQPVILGS